MTQGRGMQLVRATVVARFRVLGSGGCTVPQSKQDTRVYVQVAKATAVARFVKQ